LAEAVKKGNFGYGTGTGGSISGQGTGTVLPSPSHGMGVDEGYKRRSRPLIRQHLGEVRYCYESHVKTQGFDGKFVCSFSIKGDGLS